MIAFVALLLILCAISLYGVLFVLPGVIVVAAGVGLVSGFVAGFLANCMIAASERVTARRDRLTVDGNNNEVQIIIDGKEVYRRG